MRNKRSDICQFVLKIQTECEFAYILLSYPVPLYQPQYLVSYSDKLYNFLSRFCTLALLIRFKYGTRLRARKEESQIRVCSDSQIILTWFRN